LEDLFKQFNQGETVQDHNFKPSHAPMKHFCDLCGKRDFHHYSYQQLRDQGLTDSQAVQTITKGKEARHEKVENFRKKQKVERRG
jgi:hypothetical protein